METKEQLQQKLLEQDKKHKEEEEKLRQEIDEQDKKIKELEKKLIDQENEQKKEEQKLKLKIKELNTVQQQKLDEHKQLLEQQVNSKLQALEQMLKEVVDKSVQNEGKLSMMPSMIYLNRRFEMKNFSHEKAKNKPGDWQSPAMYTRVWIQVLHRSGC